MSKVKITVIKKFTLTDVFGHQNYPTSSAKFDSCHLFDEGQEFIVDTLEKIPEGFCGWAWRDLYKDISVLKFGGNFNGSEEGVQYTSCSDGRKPVCFKLKRTN